MMPDLAASELLARIDAGRAPVVLDVRSRAEFQRGHVPGSIHFPFWRLLFSSPPLPRAGAEGVVVYCGHGPRAQIAKTLLQARGVKQVACLAGHWSGWRGAGLRQE